jgi:hypothetical protein
MQEDLTTWYEWLPGEIVLRIFVAFKNPSLSVEFERVILGSNGKHDNSYTTWNDQMCIGRVAYLEPI